MRSSFRNVISVAIDFVFLFPTLLRTLAMAAADRAVATTIAATVIHPGAIVIAAAQQVQDVSP